MGQVLASRAATNPHKKAWLGQAGTFSNKGTSTEQS